MPSVEIKYYNVLIDGNAFFELPIKNIEETYEKIIQITDYSGYYTRGNLLDYEYFKEHYKLIAIDLSKQIELENKDIKQQINFIGNLERDNGAVIFFIIEKSTTKRWYIINDQNTGNNAYGNGEDSTTIKFETKVIKSNLCDYSDAYILVTGNIQNKPANSVVAFKNCAPFRTCDVTINDELVEKAEDLDIVMPMYNLLEYSDNYQNSTGSLYQFKRDEPPDDNANVGNATSSLVYKSKLIKGTDNNNVNNVKLVVPLKYVSNFFRSLELPLVNCKIDLELT